MPDWSSVAESFDAVRSSWAGFITTEGCIASMGDGVVTMLRYWGSERTLWLHDCFTEPEPLDSPVLTDRISDDDRRTRGNWEERQDQDDDLSAKPMKTQTLRDGRQC